MHFGSYYTTTALQDSAFQDRVFMTYEDMHTYKTIKFVISQVRHLPSDVRELLVLSCKALYTKVGVRV